MKFNEWEIRKENGDVLELVEYDNDGNLESYKVWSEEFMDHVEVNLTLLKKQWPSKFEELQNKTYQHMIDSRFERNYNNDLSSFVDDWRSEMGRVFG